MEETEEQKKLREKYTPEELKEIDEMGQDFLDGLNNQPNE